MFRSSSCLFACTQKVIILKNGSYQACQWLFQQRISRALGDKKQSLPFPEASERANEVWWISKVLTIYGLMRVRKSSGLSGKQQVKEISVAFPLLNLIKWNHLQANKLLECTLPWKKCCIITQNINNAIKENGWYLLNELFLRHPSLLSLFIAWCKEQHSVVESIFRVLLGKYKWENRFNYTAYCI